MTGAVLEYMALAVAYSVLAAVTIELLLSVWRVQEPPLDIAFRLQVLVIPPVAPLIFGLLGPEQSAHAFRHAAALLDLDNWLGPEPSLAHPLWILLLFVMAATAALEAVAFFRWLRTGCLGQPRWLTESFGRLQEAVGRMASRGIQIPSVRMVAHRGPVAYTVGLLQPCILVSPSLVNLLDDEELEGVLAHESAHVERQDNWLGWVTFALRVVSFYNPIVQFTYHRMGHDIERVCDTRAGESAGKPLALASALIKVYLATRRPGAPRRGWSSTLSSQAISLENRARRTLVEDRVERLVHPETILPTTYPHLRLGLAAAAIGCLAYLVV